MPVWVKRLSVIFSIIAIFIIWGCDSSIEKPLTKGEASNIEELQKEESEEQNSAEEKEEISDNKKSNEKTQVETEKSLDNDSIKLEGKKTETTSLKDSNTNTKEKEASAKKTENVTNDKTERSSSNKNEKKDKSETTIQSSKENVTKEKPKETNSKPKPKPEAKPEPKQSKNTIIHSIVISSNEVPLPPTEMEISEGDTVLDALIKITKEKKIQMDYRGGQGASAYVEGMANVYEFDRGPGSGWMYRVNGIFPDRGAGVVPLRPGDRVEWLYTTDLGKDLGADLKPFRR